MKISLIGPVYPYRGGIAHYTTSLAVALKNAGHDVNMLSFKRQYPAFLYPGETDKDPSANPTRVEAQYLLDPIYPWTWRQTARAILKDGSDLVLIQWWTTFWGLAYAALAFYLQKKVKVVYLIHNVLPHESHIWDRWLSRFAMGQASAFIVQTTSEGKKLLDLIPDARISYCGHPVYQRFTKRVISKEDARRELGLPMDKTLVLFFGIVRPYKGVKHLVDAISQASASIHLVIAGEFWEDVKMYKEQIEELGVSSRVTIFNKYLPNEEAHLFFSAADMMAAPYVGGTQSGAVELAVGYALPIIVTDAISAGISDVDDLPLKIVPAGSVNALAAAMDEFAVNLPQILPEQKAQNAWAQMVATVENVILKSV